MNLQDDGRPFLLRLRLHTLFTTLLLGTCFRPHLVVTLIVILASPHFIACSHHARTKHGRKNVASFFLDSFGYECHDIPCIESQIGHDRLTVESTHVLQCRDFPRVSGSYSGQELGLFGRSRLVDRVRSLHPEKPGKCVHVPRKSII